MPAPMLPGNPLPALTEATDLIDPNDKTLFPVDIPIIHPQLRHYISVVEDGTIYYAAENEIFTVRDEKRRLVAWVDFEIQCLAAAHGWVCVGGPKEGRIAFRHFALDDVASSIDLNSPSSVRSGSPEGLRYLPNSRLRQTQTAGSSGGPRPIFYKSVGNDIVNAITIQKIVPKHKDAKPEVVALLANNDKTITVFSLDQMQALKILHFEVPMNHASITRDGSLLIACGDINKAYFFSGCETGYSPSTRYAEFEWELLAQPNLAGFPDADPCFSTAFSPDEDLCTFASESGMLAKYEVGLIKQDMTEEEASAQTFSSSRPGTHLPQTLRWCGAIGSVAFSPRTVRLLAWAEAKGRVCIADLDLANRPPQVVELVKSDPKTTKVEFLDADSLDEADLDVTFSYALQMPSLPRLREGRNRATSVSAAVDSIEEAVSRQRSLQQSLSRLVERGVSPFPEQRPEEQQQQQQQRANELRRDILRNVESTLETTRSSLDSSSRVLPRARRRSSIVLGHSNNPASETSSSHPSSLVPILPSTSTFSASPSRMTSSNERSSGFSPASRPVSSSDIQEAWQTITNAMANQPLESRQALLQQNLRSLRETRASLDRSYQHSRDNALRPSDSEHGLDSWTFLETGAQSPVAGEGGLPPPTRRSASVSRLRRSTLIDRSFRSDLENSIDESQSRLQTLERDLDQISRNHTFYARATRIWQDSESSSTRDNGPSVINEETMSALRLRNERERQNMLQRLYRNRGGYTSLSGRMSTGPYSSEIDPEDDEVGIMGLAWNNTANFLYVATTYGIYKLTVNGVNRKTFPAPMVPL